MLPCTVAVSPVAAAIIAGETHWTVVPAAAVVAQVKAGRLRALGVSTAKRSPVLPELPTIAETGVPGFHAVGWFGIFSTGKTPQPVINTLNSALVATMKDPDMRERLIKQGAEPLGGSPEELRQYLAGEISKWGKVIREQGIKFE